MSDHGDVRITLRDVYDAVNGLGDKLDELASDAREAKIIQQRADARLDDHETRLRALERRVWALPSLAGALGVIGVLLSVLQWVGK